MHWSRITAGSETVGINCSTIAKGWEMDVGKSCDPCVCGLLDPALEVHYSLHPTGITSCKSRYKKLLMLILWNYCSEKK